MSEVKSVDVALFFPMHSISSKDGEGAEGADAAQGNGDGTFKILRLD